MSAARKLEPAPDPFATVRALIRMRAAGFALSVESDKLIVTPASGLSDSQRAYIRAHKQALVELLSDAETLAAALAKAGAAGLAWREGTPPDWEDGYLLAVGEILYGSHRMVNRWGRRYPAPVAPPSSDAEGSP